MEISTRIADITQLGHQTPGSDGRMGQLHSLKLGHSIAELPCLETTEGRSATLEYHWMDYDATP